MKKHKEILEDMEKKKLLTKTEEPWGNKTLANYDMELMYIELLITCVQLRI